MHRFYYSNRVSIIIIIIITITIILIIWVKIKRNIISRETITLITIWRKIALRKSVIRIIIRKLEKIDFIIRGIIIINGYGIIKKRKITNRWIARHNYQYSEKALNIDSTYSAESFSQDVS